jgi:hypothetical protein
MRLAELRKTVLAQQATEAEAKRVKVQAVKDRVDKAGRSTVAPMLLGNTDRDSTDPLMRRAYWKERGIDSPGLSTEERSKIQGPTAKVQLPVGDRPISSMYSVTPNQYQDAYGVPFTGSDPDSMRRLLSLQNGTGSVMNSERMVMDQKSQDTFDNRPKNPNPPAAVFGGMSSIGKEQQGVADINEREMQERARIGRIADLNAESISERYGIPPVETMSQMMDPDSPMATGPGRKGLVKRKR